MTASIRAARRDVRPRGHRGGIYPLMRGAMCVFVRDLVVFSVLTDMMRGRPAVYATFASYDEVAHHSGLERADTLEALRKLDQQFGRIAARAPLRAAPVRDRRPLRPRPDPGRDVQAAPRLRARRAGRALALARAAWPAIAGGDEQDAMVEHAAGEATGRKREKRAKNDVSGRDVVVLGSGNLGLVYLMELDRRLTLEEIDERHPKLIPALRAHPHIGWLLVRSADARRGRARRRAGARLPRRRTGRGRGPAGPLLARRRRATCCAPTASPTSPTSWSAASTTRPSTRAAPSRS